jgi:hypothetical protein
VRDTEYTLGLSGELKRSVSDSWRLLRPLVIGLVAFFLFFWGLGVRLGPAGHPTPGMSQAAAIGAAMEQYAETHDGKYPQGKSSTEIFQTLLDEYKYDPETFYLPLPGKVQPVPGEKLKPENVSFDVTAGADPNSPDWLPLVFTTGFKVTYAPGGSAIPLKPYPCLMRFWLRHSPERPVRGHETGIAVYYKGLGTVFLPAGTEAYKGPDSIIITFNAADKFDGSLANFVPPAFKPDGKVYQQLTPDGQLP